MEIPDAGNGRRAERLARKARNCSSRSRSLSLCPLHCRFSYVLTGVAFPSRSLIVSLTRRVQRKRRDDRAPCRAWSRKDRKTRELSRCVPQWADVRRMSYDRHKGSDTSRQIPSHNAAPTNVTALSSLLNRYFRLAVTAPWLLSSLPLL